MFKYIYNTSHDLFLCTCLCSF